jgi:hypothetical protein
MCIVFQDWHAACFPGERIIKPITDMRKFWQSLLYASFAFAMSFNASASPIYLTPNQSLLTFSGGTSQITSSVNNYLISQNLGYVPAMAYKQESGGKEEGGLAPYYSTSSAWTINPSGPALTGPTYLLVKAGTSGYLFDLTSLNWDGSSQIMLSGFSAPAISNVSIYATDGGTTLMLLGMALAGLGAARRLCRPS